jgi:hypothetical protein
MSLRKVQVGQVWKKTDNGENFLVTKVYSEALTTFAVLRKAGAEEEARIRVKVERDEDGQTLHGFSFTQESEHF